jgi:hypothetical protein
MACYRDSFTFFLPFTYWVGSKYYENNPKEYTLTVVIGIFLISAVLFYAMRSTNVQ